MSKHLHHCFLIILASMSLTSIEAAEAQTLDDLLLSIESRDVLLDEKDYLAARDALLKASDAPVRPGHPEADRARKLEVATLLAMVERRLQEFSHQA